jgi:chaperonin GroEL
MPKRVLVGNAAQIAIMRGVEFLVEPVALTEGPRGRNCIMGQRGLGQSPKCTKDGVTVCNYVDPEDAVEQMGADLIREASQKTDNVVGDGTTATAVLARALLRQGFVEIAGGANPMAMERGIRRATEVVIEHVRQSAVQIDENGAFKVATVSAHGDEYIGHLVADAVAKAGKEGIVTAEPSATSDTFVESVVGMQLDKSSLISPAFITRPDEVKCELIDCRIILWEGVIGTAKSLVPFLTHIAKNNIPVCLIAGGYEHEAMACIIHNKLKHGLPINAVRFESYGERRRELMLDIAALTGGTAFTEDLGTKIENVAMDITKWGQARKVITDSQKTQIIDGHGKQASLLGRVDMIRKTLETATGSEKDYLRRRLAALVGGITIIKVGGVTVTEMEEKKDRVIDAMSAAKAAVESGIVAGGGMALFRAEQAIYDLGWDDTDPEAAGGRVVLAACHSVVQQIAENAGISGQDVLKILRTSPNIGYNAATGEYEDLIKTGIIDPATVVCESLKNASAVACSILTMGAVVAERMEKIRE